MTDTKREPTIEELTLRSREFNVEIDREAIATRGAEDTSGMVPIAISSEYPVERYDWWEDERYNEVLEHSASAIDLTRAQLGAGLPFLDSHNAREGGAHMGLVKNIRLGPDGKLRGDVQFSKRAAAQDLRQDMLDGIRTQISVGYKIDPDNLEKSKAASDKIATVRVKRWMPYEVSSVTIPADPTVGMGRSHELSPENAELLRAAARVLSSPAPKAKETTMSEKNSDTAPADGAVSTAAVRDAARVEARAEAKAFHELAVEHKQILGDDTDARVAAWLDKGTDLATVKREILAEYSEAAKRAPKPSAAVQLNEKEQKRYSYARGVQLMVDSIEGKRTGPTFESEISDECAKRAPAGYAPKGGIFMPMATSNAEVARHNAANGPNARVMRDLLQTMGREELELAMRAGLDSATATKGAELKFPVPGPFLDFLRNYAAVYQAGASYYTGLQGPMAFIAQTAAGTASWVGENPGSDVSDSNLLLAQRSLAPNTLMSSTSYSRQLWVQGVIDIDAKVKQDLALITAIELDRAALNGSGTSNQPTGILAAAGTSTLALGTNGATPTYANLVDMESLVTAANADQWDLTYFVHPTNRGTFKKAVALSNTVGLPIWTNGDVGLGSGALPGGGSRRVGELNGYSAYASAQIPNNLTKGTSSGICLAMIFGAFPTLAIGDWGVFELIVDPYRLKKQAMIELTSFAMYGILATYPAAFCKVVDALA